MLYLRVFGDNVASDLPHREQAIAPAVDDPQRRRTL